MELINKKDLILLLSFKNILFGTVELESDANPCLCCDKNIDTCGDRKDWCISVHNRLLNEINKLESINSAEHDEETKYVLQECVNRYGEKTQLEMVVEECSELILAIQKLKRIKSAGDYADRTDDIISEVADVLIMLYQCKLIFGEEKINSEIKRKIKRQLGRLKKETEE